MEKPSIPDTNGATLLSVPDIGGSLRLAAISVMEFGWNATTLARGFDRLGAAFRQIADEEIAQLQKAASLK